MMMIKYADASDTDDVAVVIIAAADVDADVIKNACENK